MIKNIFFGKMKLAKYQLAHAWLTHSKEEKAECVLSISQNLAQ